MKLHIIAAIVDTKKLTMYLKDGSTKEIPQGDPQLMTILEEITPQLLETNEAFYELLENPVECDYVEFEGRTNGVVKFFKIAKNKLNEFLDKTQSNEPAKPAVLGTFSVIQEILAHAQKITDNHTESDNTVVAVVGDTLIPNTENLVNQIVDSNNNNTSGMENFMKRIAKVASKRMHSVQDLMKFMEEGDLPIANDGSIIIYKVLKRSSGKHSYVDCHTKSVPQSVGSYVCMDESLVDPNRHNECSNGLHVARRGYIQSFSGDVCVLAKVAPEDVIAVPQHDANKMRVSGYHILFELPNEAYQRLKVNKSMTNDTIGKTLLGKAIAGDHVGKLEEVRINGHLGKNVTFKKLMDDDSAQTSLTANIVTSVDATATSLVEKTKKAIVPLFPVIMPTTVVDNLTTTKDTLANLPTRVEKAKALFEAYMASKTQENINALVEFKRQCKCSWSKLGLPDLFIENKEMKKAEKPTTQKNTTTAPMSRAEKALAMVKNIKSSKGAEKVEKAEELASFKKQCKCSYEALGLRQAEIDLVNRLLKK